MRASRPEVNPHFGPMRTLTITVFLALLLVAASCASRKKSVRPTQPQAFEWLTAKMDIQAEGSGWSGGDLSGQIRLRRDSLLWLSVTAAMGVEVVRAKLSNDSLWLLNRMEKTYLAEPLDSLAQHLGLPLSLPWAESWLLNNKEGLAPVENQTVRLKNIALGNFAAKIRYSDIHLDEKTAFPLKISDNMERVSIKSRHGE